MSATLIGGDPISALEDELANLPTAPVPPRIANFIRRRVRVTMTRWGETAILIRGDVVTPDFEINTLAVFRMTRAEDMVGEIDQNAMDVIIDQQALIDSGWPVPMKKGDSIIRWPGDATRERVYTFEETPMTFVIGGEDVLTRGKVKG